MFQRQHQIQQAGGHQLEEVIPHLQIVPITVPEEVLRQATIQAGAVPVVQATPDRHRKVVALEADQVPIHQEEDVKTTQEIKKKKTVYEKVKLIIDRSVIYALYLRARYHRCT